MDLRDASASKSLIFQTRRSREMQGLPLTPLVSFLAFLPLNSALPSLTVRETDCDDAGDGDLLV